MQSFLARAADYTLTPLPAMLRLATRAPGLGRAPGRAPLLRRSGSEPDRMTDARARVLAAFAEYGNLGFAPTGARAASPASRRRWSRASRPRASSSARTRPATRPSRARPGDRAAPALAGAGRGRRDAARGGAAGAYSTTLLKGVTGSGKTEVYLEAVAEALARGRQALVLLPEIALSVEFLDRVEARFGARPAEWHSGVTQAARRRAWIAVASGEARLVVGARSALFLPFADLGLVVVDEEHDGSYKQEDGAALPRPRHGGAPRLDRAGAPSSSPRRRPRSKAGPTPTPASTRGSTSPSGSASPTLPEMRAIDLREDPPEAGRWISRAAGRGGRRPARGRRAVAPLPQPPRLCAADHLPRLRPSGRLRRMRRAHGRAPLPQAAGLPPVRRDEADPDRMPGLQGRGPDDRARPRRRAPGRGGGARSGPRRGSRSSRPTSPTGRGALKARIEEIAGGGADIVIGTQLVSKGHNFPLLTLVGVIDADLGLQGGDLRAAEKTFQLIRQVAGRAGRAERPGLALVQTHQPEHPALRAILTGDDEGFWRAEADARRRAMMPPYGRLAGVIVSGTDEPRTWEVARALARAQAPLAAVGAELFGPAPAPIARIRGRHRVRLLVRARQGRAAAAGAPRLGRRGPLPGHRAGDDRHRPAELLLTLQQQRPRSR